MALTPVEIRHVKLGRGFWGYRAGATDRLLEEIVQSFEEVWRERADLQDKLERLESDIARYRDLETLLRKTLVSAERSAQELKDQARRESEMLLSEAHAEARLIKQRALAEREHLSGEASPHPLAPALGARDHDELEGDDEAEETEMPPRPLSAH